MRTTYALNGARMLRVADQHMISHRCPCIFPGDNVQNSRDSRGYGAVPTALITGRVIAKVVFLSFLSFLAIFGSAI